jgi:FAD synthetase
MDMKAIEALLSRYVQKTERVFSQLTMLKKEVNISQKQAVTIVETARRYLADSTYYQEQNQYETGLVAVAYCEGLLDALRLLGLIEFEWEK